MIDNETTTVRNKTVSVSTAIFALLFCIPLLFNGSQIVTGIIVNTLLFVAARRITKNAQIFLAAIPSLGAVSHGILFGSLTVYLIYFLPFIWIGNYLLMQCMKSHNFIVAALVKSLFLFTIAYIFISLHVVPAIFFTAMGVMQLVTALIGGIIARGIIHERN
jgi:hypothetical protein